MLKIGEVDCACCQEVTVVWRQRYIFLFLFPLGKFPKPGLQSTRFPAGPSFTDVPHFLLTMKQYLHVHHHAIVLFEPTLLLTSSITSSWP